MTIIVFKFFRLLVLFLFFALITQTVRSEEIDDLITKMCLKGFMAEMNLAGKTPPKNMGEFTCNCFVKRLSTGSAISSAQSICKEEASRKFSL